MWGKTLSGSRRDRYLGMTAAMTQLSVHGGMYGIVLLIIGNGHQVHLQDALNLADRLQSQVLLTTQQFRHLSWRNVEHLGKLLLRDIVLTQICVYVKCNQGRLLQPAIVLFPVLSILQLFS